MINLFSKKQPAIAPTITVPVHNVLVIKKAICAGGHKCRINPAFVMTRTPCSGTTYCTDEPDFLFYAEGNTYDEVMQSLGNKLCHYWQLYGDVDEEMIEMHPEIKELQENFKNRVTFENDVRELQ